MRDHETEMLSYVRLAALSQQKRQPMGCDRFLVLAGAAACRAGWPDVADRCRTLILAHNPVHLVGRWPSLADALRSAEFEGYLRQQERFCPYERAEHLLRELGLPAGVPEDDLRSAGEVALGLLVSGEG